MPKKKRRVMSKNEAKNRSDQYQRIERLPEGENTLDDKTRARQVLNDLKKTQLHNHRHETIDNLCFVG